MSGKTTVGILSPGEMGHAVGHVLKENGAEVLACLKGRSERTRALCQAAGINEVGTWDQLVERSDLVLSILVPAESEAAAQTVSEAVGRRGTDLTYVDCNAISPGTAKRVMAIVEGTGGKFVDAGIIGGPPRDRDSGTRFPASGPHAEGFAKLTEYGLKVSIVGSEVGQASGLKMCYAASTKGPTALMVELLTAAHRMGLYDVLVEHLGEARVQQAERSVGGVPSKAHRWVGEMEEIAKTFAEAGLTPKTYVGAGEIFAMVAESPIGHERPETRDASRTLKETIWVLAESVST